MKRPKFFFIIACNSAKMDHVFPIVNVPGSCFILMHANQQTVENESLQYAIIT